MFLRSAFVLASFASLAFALPAAAQQLNAEEARQFVVGKTFSYTCFEGTRGAGRIRADGSVAGTIEFQGSGQSRRAFLPANTLRVQGDRVCASVRGVPFEPCFNIVRTSDRSFRGSISGFNFAYCDFTRGQARRGLIRASATPRRQAPATPAASSAATPAAEPLALRSSITP